MLVEVKIERRKEGQQLQNNDVNEHVIRYRKSILIALHIGCEFMRCPMVRPLSDLLGADFSGRK